MPTRFLHAEANAQGVALDELAALLTPLAATHFGPQVRMEVAVEDDRLMLLAAFWVRASDGPGAVSLDAATRHFGAGQFELDDELMFQVFFTPEDVQAAVAQDAEYLALAGLSSVGCGFWPIARHAVETRLGIVDPLRAVTARAVTLAVEADARFVLRHQRDGAFVLKELVEARPGGEVDPRTVGRRDVVEGTVIEVTRRVVSARELVAGLKHPDLAARACESEPDRLGHLEARLARHRSVASLDQLVPGELEGRFLP